MQPQRKNKVSEKQRKKHQKRRDGIIEILLKVQSVEKIAVIPFLEDYLGSRGRMDYQWIKQDVEKWMWEDSQEYSKYSHEQKTKLWMLLEKESRSQIDQEMDMERSEVRSFTNQIAMAQSVPPGDIQTQPDAKIRFQPPYNKNISAYLTLINPTNRSIAYALKGTSLHRIGVEPAFGFLDPEKAVALAVSCDAFAYGEEDTSKDRITVEWTNNPDLSAKKFRPEWFQGDGMVRRKELSIEYTAPTQSQVQKTPEDRTQSEKSGENSPELEQQEDIGKQKEKMTVRTTFPTIKVRRLFQCLTPYVRSCVPPEESKNLDALLLERAGIRPEESIEKDQLKFLVELLCWAVVKTGKESYSSAGLVTYTLSSLYSHTLLLLKQLGVDQFVENTNLFEKGVIEGTEKKYSSVKIVEALELCLRNL